MPLSMRRYPNPQPSPNTPFSIVTILMDGATNLPDLFAAPVWSILIKVSQVVALVE